MYSLQTPQLLDKTRKRSLIPLSFLLTLISRNFKCNFRIVFHQKTIHFFTSVKPQTQMCTCPLGGWGKRQGFIIKGEGELLNLTQGSYFVLCLKKIVDRVDPSSKCPLPQLPPPPKYSFWLLYPSFNSTPSFVRLNYLYIRNSYMVPKYLFCLQFCYNCSNTYRCV